jgi:N-formylglutamate deformylase
MLSDPLVSAFETAAVDPTRFGHREHLYVAWCYLRALPVEDALARYVRHLRQLTCALGVPEKFHATMTWAYVVLVHDAMERSPGVSFDSLLARNPALLDHQTGALYAHYGRAELDAEDARHRFVLPRRA